MCIVQYIQWIQNSNFNGLQLHSLALHMVHMVSSCDESQTGISLYSPPDQTGILWQQWPPVTQNVLHSQVVPNKLKASVHKVTGDTRINTSLVPMQAFLGSCKQSQTGVKLVTVNVRNISIFIHQSSIYSTNYTIKFYCCFWWPCKMWTKKLCIMWQISCLTT